MNKKTLWLNIANYHFDHLVPKNIIDTVTELFGGQNASTKAFADKLSRKLNWNKDFAMRAIWEYKKFVFLGVISDFSVTPSKIIDQVWHEHLLFTIGYRKFCEEIIQYDFAHHPELIPDKKQISMFKNQLLKTLELYKKEFGAEPPAEIWDTSKFKEEKIKKQTYATDYVMASSSSYDNDSTLVSMISENESDTFDFDGGDFGGGGSDGSWSDSSSDGDSGSDSGSSCSSSCSSSCGGGCGGGD